jgi:hypothetical protein
VELSNPATPQQKERDHAMSRHTLDDDTLAAICQTAETEGWEKTVIDTYSAIGFDLNDPDCPQVNPSDHKIPEHQWKQICNAINSTGRDQLSQANHMLDWVNYGPSSF